VTPPRPSRARPAPAGTLRERLAGARTVFRQVPGTLRLVWGADRRGAVALAALTLVAALLPAAVAWV
jgi:ATP-binding cassette subfamily B protein